MKDATQQQAKTLKVKTNLKAGALGDPCEPQWYAGYRNGWNDYQDQFDRRDRRPSPI
jgi:hypothetical protein